MRGTGVEEDAKKVEALIIKLGAEPQCNKCCFQSGPN